MQTPRRTNLEVDLLSVGAEHPVDTEARKLRAVLAKAEREDRHESRCHPQRGSKTSKQEPFQTPAQAPRTQKHRSVTDHGKKRNPRAQQRSQKPGATAENV